MSVYTIYPPGAAVPEGAQSAVPNKAEPTGDLVADLGRLAGCVLNALRIGPYHLDFEFLGAQCITRPNSR